MCEFCFNMQCYYVLCLYLHFPILIKIILYAQFVYWHKTCFSTSINACLLFRLFDSLFEIIDCRTASMPKTMSSTADILK